MMNQQEAMKLEIVPQPTRNWLDLPSELTANILYRIGVVDIIQSAQKVCTVWREICKDPTIWRVIYMDASSNLNTNISLDDMCKHLVDRSQGQLVDVTIVEFGNNEIFRYIANRSCKLKHLTIACCGEDVYDAWEESLKKFPLLEELSLYETVISEEGIETAGGYCPMLKTLKVNQGESSFWGGECEEWYMDSDGEIIVDEILVDNDMAMIIGQHLHELRHLELIGNAMSNEGLKMILDGCHRLELLDLRGCLLLDLDGDLGKRCLQQIKCVKLPKDSLEGCPYIYKNDDMISDVDDESDEESEGGPYVGSEGGPYVGSEGGSDEESDGEMFFW